MRVLLDGAGVRKLAGRTPANLALLSTLAERGLWPAIVPTVVLADCLVGDADEDRHVNRLLRCCDVADTVPHAVARRAAWLRTAAAGPLRTAAAGRATAADAVVVALAEPGGAVLTAGPSAALEAVALFASGVYVERI